MTSIRTTTMTFAMTFILFGAGAAHAKGGDKPCKADREKLCAGKEKEDAFACMAAKVSELTPECKAKVEKRQKRADEHANACKDEREKFCKDVKVGAGRMAACLHEHEAELGASCKKKHAEVKGQLKDLHKACKDDVKTLCADVKAGDGRLLKCLADNQAKLSGDCAEELNERN